jgi:hypothetical protein
MLWGRNRRFKCAEKNEVGHFALEAFSHSLQADTTIPPPPKKKKKKKRTSTTNAEETVHESRGDIIV